MLNVCVNAMTNTNAFVTQTISQMTSISYQPACVVHMELLRWEALLPTHSWRSKHPRCIWCKHQIHSNVYICPFNVNCRSFTWVAFMSQIHISSSSGSASSTHDIHYNLLPFFDRFLFGNWRSDIHYWSLVAAKDVAELWENIWMNEEAFVMKKQRGSVRTLYTRATFWPTHAPLMYPASFWHTDQSKPLAQALRGTKIPAYTRLWKVKTVL